MISTIKAFVAVVVATHSSSFDNRILRGCRCWTRRIKSSWNGSHTFFKVQNQSKSGVAVEIVPMKPFATQEAQAFIEFHGGCVGDFCFEGDLFK